jgi:hypothetical protein
MKTGIPIQILCPFCNKPYHADMENELDYTTSSCDTCNHGEGATSSVKIFCSNCGKLVYQKDYSIGG